MSTRDVEWTDDKGRRETAEERADRRRGDPLQELRVAQTGVRIPFGFLPTVVFQQRFTRLSATDRHIYAVTVVLGAGAHGRAGRPGVHAPAAHRPPAQGGDRRLGGPG